MALRSRPDWLKSAAQQAHVEELVPRSLGLSLPPSSRFLLPLLLLSPSPGGA